VQPGQLDLARIKERLGLTMLIVWPQAATPEVVAAAKAVGLHVRCGIRDDLTFDETYALFQRLVAMGVDEFSCGRPDWIGCMVRLHTGRPPNA